MKELDWLRSKAALVQTNELDVSSEEAREAGCKPGTYHVQYWTFEGNVPFRMIQALRKAQLANTETQSEVLRLGTGYRGGECYCRYMRSVYTRKE